MDQNERKLMGSRIRSERESIGYSQDALAEKLGMGRANVANYESGRVIPPSNILKVMSELFGVTSDYLLGSTENRGGEKVNDKLQITEGVRSLARDIQELDSDSIDALALIIKTMKQRGREANEK